MTAWSPPPIVDALEDSAPLALELSRDCCPPDTGCAPLHGLWQFLRLLGLVNTPRTHGAFFRGALRPLIRRGARRVLISASADTAMLAVVLDSFAAERVVPSITVIDLCRTPLRLCEWFARRHGAEIATAQADVLDYRAPAAFDIVCTHAFLGEFAPAERPRLFARWRELLAPGGCVLSVNRLRPDATARVGFSSSDAKDFRERFLAAAADAPWFALQTAAEWAAMCDAYVAYRQAHPLRSAAELEQLVAGAGMKTVALQASAGPPAAGGLGAPTLAAGATFLEFVAARPGE